MDTGIQKEFQIMQQQNKAQINDWKFKTVCFTCDSLIMREEDEKQKQKQKILF